MAEMVEAVLNGRYKIILPKHRADRPEWYTEEGWEGPRLDRLQGEISHQISKGKTPVVYYVGAEEGDMCGLAAKWGAKLVMFEPNERVSPNIKAIWRANKLEPPLAYFEGFAANVTDLKGKNALHIGKFPASADGEVIGDHGFKELAYEHDVVPQIKIDDITDNIEPPTIITMDVEGSEFEVLKGSEKTIASS